MNKKLLFVIICLLTIFLLVFFAKKASGPTTHTHKEEGVSSGPSIKYWTCPMHPSVRQDKPGKCPICNMDLIPVYEEIKKEEEQKEERAYYGCGVKEEGHCPKCDEGKLDQNCICGEHTFVMEGAEKMVCPVCKNPLKKIEPPLALGDSVSRVRLSAPQMERSGIRTEPVMRHRVTKEIRTVGKIAFDPELAVAQEEFLTALETKEKVSQSPDPDVIRRAEDIVAKSILRIKLLGMNDAEIDKLKESKTPQMNLVLPGNKVWVYADVYEYELGWINVGQGAVVTATAYPGEKFSGTLRSINPVLDPNTRSARVRLELDNPNLKLKPEMFVDVSIQSEYSAPDGEREVLVVPKEAALDTGRRKIVYVQTGVGEFVGKEVELGPEGTVETEARRFYPVLKGLSEGTQIVTKGNFLIDSQSQLTGGMSVLWGGATEIKETPEETTQHRH